MKSAPCLIVNMSEPLEPDHFGNDQIIPERCRPKYVHDDLDSARAECLRLHSQKGSSGANCRFVIFQAVEFSEWRDTYVPARVAVLESFERLDVRPVPEVPTANRD